MKVMVTLVGLQMVSLWSAAVEKFSGFTNEEKEEKGSFYGHWWDQAFLVWASERGI